jgi:hypothetical protein
MALYGQPNSWQCGPFALKHALLAYGVFAHEDDLARAAGSSPVRGTDEVRLRRAARLHGFDLGVVRRTSARAARRELAGLLERGTPVLLCFDQWEHWVTALSADDAHVVVCDSYYDSVLRLEPWETVLDRLAYRERGWQGLWSRTLFDLHPVLARGPATVRLDLPPARAARLLQEDAAPLAQVWDVYARGLLELAEETGDEQLELGVPLEAVVSGCREALLAEVVALRGPEARGDAEQLIEALTFTARLFDVNVRPDLERHALPRLVELVLGSLPPVHQESAQELVAAS